MDETNNRESYLRVTQVLYPFSGLEKINADIVAYAAERGTKVHKICESIISGLGEFGIDDETWGYVESFKKWWGLGHEVIEMEKRFWCDEFQITGQVDLIINTPEGLTIVDLKTSSKPSKTWKAQGQAYSYLARKAGYNIQKVQFLHLNKHGKEPKIIEYDNEYCFFFSILQVYNYFFKGK